MQLLTRSLRSFSVPNYWSIANFDPELQELQKAVRRFAEEKVAPLAAKTDLEDKFPAHLWREFGDLGILGVTTPS